LCNKMNLEHKPARKRERQIIREQGAALLLVTWIISVMGVVALFLLYRSGAEWAAVNSLSRRMSFQETAEDVLHDWIIQLNADKTGYDDETVEWYNNGRIDEERNGYDVTVIIEDEGSKPNLNYVKNYHNVAEVFLPKDVSIAPLQDWLDSDDSAMEDGAENSYYQSLNPPYKCRSGFLSSLEELKEIKNGNKLYKKLAPEFTIIGKVNPNTIIRNTFDELMYSHGFDKFWVNTVDMEFNEYLKNNRFNSIDDFTKLPSVSVLKRDQLRPLFRFDGFCNVNFSSEKALQYIFKDIGLETDKAKNAAQNIIISQKKRTPFTNQLQLNGQINVILQQFQINNVHPEDYFTFITTVVRYKIWIKYGESTYFLNTVWERFPVTNKKTKWQSHSLSWLVLMNRESPDIPIKPETETDKENKTGKNENTR
jgi:type II secretory pathway component PulK